MPVSFFSFSCSLCPSPAIPPLPPPSLPNPAGLLLGDVKRETEEKEGGVALLDLEFAQEGVVELGREWVVAELGRLGVEELGRDEVFDEERG
mmetsp:Transcript_23698/g.42210  ORF Transcript_23698/g.42210 Transcript_23698/m.42210 type:complete len:92 (-) Transcript_23698:18-293(-)